MSKTIGQHYDSILIQIEKTQESQSYQTGSGDQLTRGQLSTLYAERNRLLEKIERYGRNHIEGQNTAPIGDIALVSFV
ncbi:hypothetical protein AAX26_01804 [Aliarcobacter thereius]|uniref:hypothetical protein n=1 Tax=Aliarcobacter thereius TaxID=544718 RepID=UPI0008287BE8|nr:hypothetical protein [Aliarcobacter thereius]OCL85737.1 hypothetical protein AAX26_01804 [Aliarcobacter thereius]